MPGVVMNGSSPTGAPVHHGRWIDQQRYLIETYRQIRTNLGQLEAEIEAARLRVTDWSRVRREPSRSRSLSHASISTTASSRFSCSTMGSGGTATTDGTNTTTTCSSCCCSNCDGSTCGLQLPPATAASLSAAALITAFLAASTSPTTDSTGIGGSSNANSAASHQLTTLTTTGSANSSRARTPDKKPSASRTRSNRSASPSST